jgi:hypothetical protein
MTLLGLVAVVVLLLALLFALPAWVIVRDLRSGRSDPGLG